MKSLHIITPVKDSIDTTLETVRAVLDSKLSVPFTYTVYNDFSTPENTARLEAASREMGFGLLNLPDLTPPPSPTLIGMIDFENHCLKVLCSGGKHNLPRILNYLQSEDISFGRVFSELPTLNDVFLEITGKQLRD